MNKFTKHSIITACVVVLTTGIIMPSTLFAATSPSLGSEAVYGIVSDTYTNTLNAGTQTIINGAVCYTTPPGTAPVTITGATVVPCDPLTAGPDQIAALANINGQACVSIGAGAVDLNAITVGANPPGTFPPGCYTSGGAMNIVLSTTVTLSGVGTYIFRPGGGITTGQDSLVTLAGGASACDVFWAPNGNTTLGANTAPTLVVPTFVGNILNIAPNFISIGHFAHLLGRALAFGQTVTTDSNTITVPTCPVAPAPAPAPSSARDGTINVVKVVINDNGGTKTISDFPLSVNGRLVLSGVTNTFTAPAAVYNVRETGNANYTQTFSGDCDVAGRIGLNPGENKFCIITNDDIGAPIVVPPIPPLIDVVKVPSPLALPGGPGPVAYTYTLRNIGTVPVTDITMVGDTCSPIVLSAGDTNADAKLDVSETWVYRCATALSKTHTNTVVTTGWANGVSAVDITSATVVVGLPVVPPLIHVTKIPSPLALNAGGGMVTYTQRVTNPGTVALSNVVLYDDKCSPVQYVSGDANGNSKLEPTETWIYSCKANLTRTTTNTVVANGEANGLVARDLAVVTVIVTAPGLPNTGISPEWKSTLWNIVVLSILLCGAIFIVTVLRKRKI